MSTPWLDVVGIGADGIDGLGAVPKERIASAHLVVGGERHLAMVAGIAKGERLAWETPMAATIERLTTVRGRLPVVVLASGDPLWFGVGRRLLARFKASELCFHPHVSAFQLAAARLAWPLADVACISLHGRGIDHLNSRLADRRRLLVLTRDGSAPAEIGERLAASGFGRSSLRVLENLGAADERIVQFPAFEAAHRRFADLNTLAIELVGETGSGRPLTQGLSDESYLHDGQLTKQEVRAVTLARLAPRPGELLWDIGAGSGAIGIEWLLAGRATPDLSTAAVAVEVSAERVARIIENAHRLGVPQLKVLEGRAPAVLPDDPAPDAIFVGGGMGTPHLIESCLERLKPGGRLVINAVTLAGEARLLDLQKRHGGELGRIAISRSEPLGRGVGWKAMAPVTQWSLVKPRIRR